MYIPVDIDISNGYLSGRDRSNGERERYIDI
jgi:hypothetical protein